MKYAAMATYLCGCFYVFLGTHTRFFNLKSRVNKQFFRLTTSLAIWAIAFAISSTEPTAESSAFWRSISVFGWGVFQSVLLHFILIITEYKNLSNKRSALLIIYLPAVINIVLFAPFGYFAAAPFETLPTAFSGINVLGMNLGRIWISIYRIVFSTAAVLLVIRWRIEHKSNTIRRKRITYLLMSVILPYFVIVAVDIMPFESPLFPALEVVINIIPTIVMFYLLKTSGRLFERSRMEFLHLDSNDFPDESRLQLFRTAARIFGAGAAASFFLAYFIGGSDLAKELPLALTVLMFSLFLALIPHIIKSHSLQNTLFLIISILGQSYFIITNIDKGAETVWVVYVVFLLYTVLLNSDIHALIFIGITVAIQVALAITLPKTTVVINNVQYLSRFFIILLSYYAVRHLTKEYALKLRGYRRYAKEQETLEKVSNIFVSVNRETVIEKMGEMYRLSQERLGFDQAYLIEFSADYEDALIFSSYIVNESIPCCPGMKVKAAVLPMAKTLIDQKQPIACENIENIPDAEERNYFASRGINSYYAIPILINENITGMLVVEYRGKSDVRLSDNRLTFLGIVANILGDAKKKSLYEEELYNIAYFDENTKLANRNMLKSNIEKILHDRNESEKLVIFDIELDNLRMITDTYGHNTGEQVVIKVAAILKGMMREGCTLSRISQGKLVVVMPITETREQMEECARIIAGAFSDPILPGEGIESLFVTTSIGIAVYPDDGRDADTLLKNADLASYEARVSGNQVVFCTEQLKRRIENNTILTNRLFNSMKNEEFSLEFQPQVSCSTGKTVGVEALLRWTTVDNKRVGPDTFIPMLEQTGLIHDVGLWVLEQALREHNRLVSKGFPALRFSVNLSVVQFQKDDFVLNVTRIVEQSRVDPKYIELEITESMLSKNFSDSIQKLGQLKELGLNIAIDDFGKGYSSLHRLDMVPFNRIKIDKSIIDDIDFETKKSVIAKVIVSLARALMADITAEGVETKAQADFMKEISCDEIQGYLYSRPLSSEALEEFLKNEALRADA